MKVSSIAINKSLLRIKRDLFGNGFPKMYTGGEAPLRSELLSADQMEEHGKTLAGSHTLGLHHSPDQYLLSRLAENEAILTAVRTLIIDAIKVKRQISPAAEWLIDNFYLIEENIQTGKKNLPKAYSKELPRLGYGSSKGLPRVYDIALETISHGDGRVDPESLSRFVTAYQSITILKLGELWAIPIMLRLALIENLRRVGAQVADGRMDRDLADLWADKMMEITEKDPKSLILVIADMARSKPPMTPSFVSEFVRRLQGQSPALALPLTWIEQQLSESGLTIERLIHLGNQQQAADQISISNSIDSLRFIGAMDWKEFVETLSIVDQTLRRDPDQTYNRMDFATRDYYRHAIEKIARRSKFSEAEVTQQAISLAQESEDSKGVNDRTAHVGYYLIDKGLPQLEKLAEVHFSVYRALQKVSVRISLLLYTGSILLLTKILTSSLMAKVYSGGIHGWLLGLMVVILFISTVHLAVALVNWLATLLVIPKPLPRMDFSSGIPPESRTLVVIPTLLINIPNTDELMEALEVRFLANQDENLHFGLLTDFLDADNENMPEDEPLLEYARKKIEELSKKYIDTGKDTFFLFHRPRTWNPGERIWMGYERKRGKLSELNSLLQGSREENFSMVIGNTEVLSNVKFIITLDSDTQLPRDSARQFVGTMAHPLNRAYYDEKKQRVSVGYGIMQPRVAVSLPATKLSRYSRLYGSEPGIDPYTRVVSDVYQDVFGEGSFIGKGIYDVEIFGRVFDKRFPENRILSHDLLEGCYARAGLLSDVQLFEEYPMSYFADVNRRHRWIRGDWQILKWLLPFVTGTNGKLQKNPLSALSKWKIFDNIRRSITPLALTLLLVLGWTTLSQALLWTLVVVVIIVGPSVVISIVDLFNKPVEILLRSHLMASVQAAGRHLAQSAFMFICLPYEAFYSLDAISRTIWRIMVSHRRLLEWNPSHSHDQNDKKTIISSYKTMWIAPVFAIVTVIFLFVWWPVTLAFVWPIQLLWFVSPAIVWWFSNIPAPNVVKLNEDQKFFLRNMARKTWTFFETFVGPEDNWLPPDNYQETPSPKVAHRTSPTNIGLSLLANLSAFDFGYIQAGQLLERTAKSFHSMKIMERYKGHFFNWYDTQSLKPLQPRYISSVDSGNLAGHLMILRSGLLSIPDQKIMGPRLFEGISDTLRILISEIRTNLPSQVGQFQNNLNLALNSQPATLSLVKLYLDQLVISAEEIVKDLMTDDDDLSLFWAKNMASQCHSAVDELKFLAPWLFLDKYPDLHINFPGTDDIPTLRELTKIDERILPAIEYRLSIEPTSEMREYAHQLRVSVAETINRANDRLVTIKTLSLQPAGFVNNDYDFLYDKGRHLQSIGYNVDERRQDSGYYDLLASEARFTTFVAISQGQVPQESWFALGRLVTVSGGNPLLLSWSGSMFEYLMPLLVMPTYENTLLDQTYKSAVKRQIAYGKQRGVPWGISESGYNMVDVNLNYQYKAFGVPGMGLKRGLAEDLVVAPYASMLALMVEPEVACLNLQRLADEKVTGKFGFYEAIDYTSSRLNRSQSGAIVQSYMAHHQGMSLLSLAYQILDRPMQKRFESDPVFQATLLLLQEKIPKTTSKYSTAGLDSDIRVATNGSEMPVRVINTPDTLVPEVHLLSNGRYHVVITSAGGGYSNWNDISITRWREDTTRDNWGMFCYIRDLDSGDFWSTAYQPTIKQPVNYEAIFSKGRAEFRRRDNDLDTHLEIVVSPEDDIELRRIRITNRSRRRRSIDVTSYAEVVIASAAADAIHPAFSNLFVQTEIIDQRQMILCTRRQRSQDEKVPWMFHLMTMHGAEIKDISYETDRMKFIGRGNSVASPQAMTNSGPLSGSQGSVLDPIVAIRYKIILDPEESAKIDMVSGISETRKGALSLVDKYQDRRLANRVFELAWTYSQIILTQINASEADAQLYGKLAGSVIFANSSLRADPGILIKNRRGQSGLWGYSISGDLPIVLLKIEDPANIKLVRQLVQAHAYWRLKGLVVDLVIWNEDHAGYRQLLNDQILGLIAAGLETNIMDRPGGIFVRATDQISNEDRILIQTVARAIISDRLGSLAEQINRHSLTEATFPPLKSTRNHHPATKYETALPRNDLIFFNGIGGFTPDGREYVITSSREQVTPAPWVNVLANPNFGTVVSEMGNSYTWSENAHEIRLTPWNNDPVSDAGGEAFYIRDEESGHFWSPTPLQGAGMTLYVIRHGFGYSIFEHTEDGIRSELMIYVAIDAPVKFSVLKLKNESDRPRRLSVTGYVEWVLGDLRSKSAMHVSTGVDPGTGALLARNPYNAAFGDRVAFFQTDDSYRNITCDRTEFIGRNGTLRNPAAMYQSKLSGKVGAGLDPCAAIQVSFELAAGKESETIFRLGTGLNADNAVKLLRRFWGPTAAHHALEAVWKFWKQILGTVVVDTPDRSLNLLINGWLMYQVLACRIWARSGYYQSGGAFGFRDQLQDVMALIHVSPHLVREHLLLCASRQFREGDVQHWWHPPNGQGVRTHCSDDYLWLPLATSRYVLHTGDTGVLEEQVHFLEGRPVNSEEDSYYDLPGRSDEISSLYQHCIRAIINGLSFGGHGLPLMGTGDWNDGMNLVGNKGKGESVWLGFFLYEVLMQFTRVAKLQKDLPFAERCLNEASKLRQNIERYSWDGGWYLRAWFDNGLPLGSAENSECQIDSIPQSWSVLSSAGDPDHARKAMDSVYKKLVRRDDNLIQLLDPPFDKSIMNPGYIKGYVPGVRENGGQYTHAAIWAAMAFARSGEGKRAWELMNIINPVNHAASREDVEIYKVEPYVVAADVYAVYPHTGRGGWTWYTGSAGLMYRLITESLLGLRLEVNKLYIEPCIPADWTTFKVNYRYRETVFHITITQILGGGTGTQITLDGTKIPETCITLLDDRKEHMVIWIINKNLPAIEHK